MSRNDQEWRRWVVVGVFAVAMAWMEAATVYYLRTLVDRVEPHQPDPLPIATGLGQAELVRELATMVMLFTVGWLAGRTWLKRFGYLAVAFGIWDIFYYAFLRVMTGWPKSLTEWDILFLMPLPWWGPVWAPTSIALLMIFWGTSVARFERPAVARGSNWKPVAFGALGVGLALYVFMSDAIRVAGQGAEALRVMLPAQFNWPLFAVALMLMAVPVIDAGRQTWRNRTTLNVTKD